MLQWVQAWQHMLFTSILNNDRRETKWGILSTHHLWASGKAITELHKITFISKKDIKSWLVNQGLGQVHIQSSKKINHLHYDVTKPNAQHPFDLLYVPHNVFEGNTYKYIWPGVDVASRYKVVKALKTKKASEVAYLLKAIYKKREVCFNTQRYFIVIMGLSLKVTWQSYLKNKMLIFEEQQKIQARSHSFCGNL